MTLEEKIELLNLRVTRLETTQGKTHQEFVNKPVSTELAAKDPFLIEMERIQASMKADAKKRMYSE